MIERIEAPEGVLAFRAVGEVHSDDYDTVLEPAVAAAAADGGKLRLVYVLGPEFTSYSTGASWEDTKLGFGHFTAFERFAVVTSHDWVAHLVKAFGWLIPGKVKVFEVNALDDALVWAAATD